MFLKSPIGLLLVLVLSSGCSISKFAINTIADGLGDSTDTLRGHFDYETAGHAAASTILQLEAFHSISPDNENLSLALAQTYVAYAYGWVMDQGEVALFEDEIDLAARHKRRAHLMYSRAFDVILRAMRNRDPGIDEVIYGEDLALEEYLQEEYGDPEDVRMVFWLAMVWGTAINVSPHMDDLINLPNVKVLARHARGLDSDYEDGGAMLLLGGLEAAYPKALGGDPEKGREYFEETFGVVGRKSHVALINYAKTYLVNTQQRQAFVDIMHEILEAPDQGGRFRLSNKVARRRAERYLANLDYFF